MIRGLVGFAMAGALIASPAAGARAGPEFSGRGELRASYVHLDGGSGVIQGGEAHDLWTLGGGSLLDVASGPLHLQADFSGEATVGESSADDTYQGSYGGGLHLNLRDPDRGSLGVFGGVGKLEIHDSGASDPDSVAWGVGAEGQAYFDALTLYLQAGYLGREPIGSGGDPDALKDAGFGRVVGRYFCGDDVKLEAEGSFTQGQMDPDSDDVWLAGWGFEAEFRPHDWPVSAFAAYRGAYYDQSDDNDTLTEHRVGFGLRVYFGHASLKANDRHGASLDLPRYLEWNGQIAGPLE